MNTPSPLKEHVIRWAAAHPLSPSHIDCTTAVMLKILDGKCKMKPESKVVMEMLYDAVKDQPGVLLLHDTHALIERARSQLTDEMKEIVYENRLLAETMISRPVMKHFKALIKELGLFDFPEISELKR